MATQCSDHATPSLPPFDEQKKIADALDAVDTRAASEHVHNTALNSLFQTLLQDLMTGRIHVNELDFAELETAETG